MNVIQLLELVRLWTAPPETYLQPHDPVTADKEAPATVRTSRGATAKETRDERNRID